MSIVWKKVYCPICKRVTSHQFSYPHLDNSRIMELVNDPEIEWTCWACKSKKIITKNKSEPIFRDSPKQSEEKEGNMYEELAEFQQELDNFLNSQLASDLVFDRRYSDLESEMVRLRKRTFSDKNLDYLLMFGYLDSLTNRKMLFKIYGMLINLIHSLEKKEVIEPFLTKNFMKDIKKNKK